MAIQFACPSCREPIEVDDEWAGKAVSCPYCRHVVTAPMESTWSIGRPPAAVPAAADFRGDAAGPTAAPAEGGGVALWALTMALTGCMLSCLAYGGLLFGMLRPALERAGPGATPEQLRSALEEYSREAGSPRLAVSGFVVACTLIGTGCSLGGLALAIRALLRPGGRKGMAVVACVLSAGLLTCQGQMLMLVALAGSAAAGP